MKLTWAIYLEKVIPVQVKAITIPKLADPFNNLIYRRSTPLHYYLTIVESLFVIFFKMFVISSLGKKKRNYLPKQWPSSMTS